MRGVELPARLQPSFYDDENNGTVRDTDGFIKLGRTGSETNRWHAKSEQEDSAEEQEQENERAWGGWRTFQSPGPLQSVRSLTKQRIAS